MTTAEGIALRSLIKEVFSMIKRNELEDLRAKLPAGTRVELVEMQDLQAPPAGTKGTVKEIDDIGTIHVAWDNGSGLGLVHNVDIWKLAD